ncbi:hypothetical protein [Nonlabens ulvanivorans]|uniref:hypothetical protein n=1 Tax=Nonlabens ulvanivorans TaxID=906888 RepID=UPI0029428917|nr:hypothetical protein [Nonlabens ulvanivorans]WOI23405.1 hypothetical protein R1T42_02910 [Nonlabens ulvanivorans]
MKHYKITFILLVLILGSCKPIYFYQTTRDRVQSSSKDNIEKIQFFNDEKITIVYRTASRDESITGGKVKFEEGYYNYYITFPKKTPAVAKDLDEKRLKVYFESGEDKYLVFGKYDDGKYGLYGISEDDGFYVNFEGKRFKVIEGKWAELIIKKNIKIDVESDKRKVKGVKVG